VPLSVSRDRVGRREAAGEWPPGTTGAPVIEFRDVTKRYPDGTIAVDKLNLTVDAGAITVFVGPSGCGKTTSLRMVNRMIDATSGSILIDGKDIRDSDPALLRRGIGYVIQQAGLFPHRTVLDNVATVPLLSGWDKRKARARAAELLETVGLAAEMGKRYPAQLSGGQQQRVGVARALAADPPILLMDEPFSAVDPVVREELQNELLRLQNELDKTIIFVTHDIDEAVRIGEKVAVFRKGGVLAQYGTPAEVLRDPADDFVTSFVGRDRGYRGLSFLEFDGTEVDRVPAVTVGEPLPTGRSGWVVAVDADRRPCGWIGPKSTVDGVLTRESLVAGGSLYTEGTSLRGALDSALSSPAALGVVVDTDGRYVGVVSARKVLDVIDSRVRGS
jgi:osmoprotectant transport system ATP-binding protein